MLQSTQSTQTSKHLTQLTYKGYSIPLEGLSAEDLKKLKEDLTARPLFVPGYGKEPDGYPVYRLSPVKIYVPKFYGIEKFGSPKEASSDINAERIGLPLNPKIKFTGSLREDQIAYVNNILVHVNKNDACIACAKTGEGKTVFTLNIIARIKRKTLIIVHKEFLLNQWIERANQFLPEAKITTIRGQTIDTSGDIVIGMLQSISMKEYDRSVFDDFGLLVSDECVYGEQLIVTDKGPKKISEIYEMWAAGERDINALSYNETNDCFEYKKVTYAWENHNEDLLEIKYSGSIIKCTENHRILTPTGYTEAINLKVDDLIKSNSNEDCTVLSKTGTVKIKSIEKIKNPDAQNRVYDLEVEDNHNFVLASGPNNMSGPIVHNCHHICSKTFSKALFKCGTKKMIGLSATPNRQDGLTKVLTWFMGPIISKDAKQSAIDNPTVKIIKPEYEEEIEIKYNYLNKIMVPDLINKITADPVRNAQIVSEIIDCHEMGRNIILLSDRRNHCIELKDMLEEQGLYSGLYLGGMKQEELEETNKMDIILSSYAMASEGYDNPKIDTVIFASSKGNVVQSCGRALRRKNVHAPLFIDFADVKYMYSQYKKRKAYYKNQGFIIIEDGIEAKKRGDGDEDSESEEEDKSSKKNNKARIEFRDEQE